MPEPRKLSLATLIPTLDAYFHLQSCKSFVSMVALADIFSEIKDFRWELIFLFFFNDYYFLYIKCPLVYSQCRRPLWQIKVFTKKWAEQHLQFWWICILTTNWPHRALCITDTSCSLQGHCLHSCTSKKCHELIVFSISANQHICMPAKLSASTASVKKGLGFTSSKANQVPDEDN